MQTLLGNVIFDSGNPESRLRPYLGMGLGLARTSVRIAGRYDSPQPEQRVGGDTRSTGFAWQVQAGVGVRLNSHLSADLSYRYLGVPDVELETVAVSPWLKSFEGDYSDRTFSAGLRWSF